jgi:hypothetical protein
MRFHSAKEDLEGTTLSLLPGLLARLDYLAGLRHADGGYAHWGLEKVHGREAAQAALGAAHRDTLAKFLRQTVAQLYLEVKTQPAVAERAVGELLPEGADALEARHFSLVWAALTSVARHHGSRRPAA